MAEVKVLIKGYASEESEQENSCSTVTLIRDKDMDMIVDPGTLKSQQVLIDKLKQEGLTIEDINWVCITHSHMDHYRNIGMFPKAKSLDYWGIWENDTVEDWNSKLKENIEIIKTPGHSYDSITLFIKTPTGIVAVCGDVFWKENLPENDPYASDKEKLKESRKLVLKKADYIVPGHGDMYKVKK